MLALASCSSSHADAPPPHRAFYYWRTTLQLSEPERTALAELHVDRLYVRMFDIVPDGEVGVLAVNDTLPAGIDVVPVVFIRDEVFRHPKPGLAARKWRDIQRIAMKINVTID